MNLAQAFSEAATLTPGKTALFWAETEYSYGRLLAQTRAVAARLRDELGVKAGDRVGLWLKNCPEFVPALMGVLEAGAAVVPINNFLKPAEVSYILQDAGINPSSGPLPQFHEPSNGIRLKFFQGSATCLFLFHQMDKLTVHRFSQVFQGIAPDRISDGDEYLLADFY